MSDKRVESIKNIDMSDLKFPTAAVHVSPLDYPGKAIARIFDMFLERGQGNGPSFGCSMMKWKFESKGD